MNNLIDTNIGGLCKIQIEDTDKERSTKKCANIILASLRTIGVGPDLDQLYESQKNEIFKAATQQLVDSNQAFNCDCSVAEVDHRREKHQ